VSLDRARVEMDLIVGQLQRAHPKDNAKSGIAVIDLRDLLYAAGADDVVGVFGAALCLMLIACTNVANLLFARARRRSQYGSRLVQREDDSYGSC
jgi:hypothetical protein